MEKWSAKQYQKFLKGVKKKKHHRGHVSSGKRTIGGKEIYFRSKAEANYARYLQWRLEYMEIKSWQYEPKKFWFPLRSGTNHYTPDFLVEDVKGHLEWHEVKGWLDQKSKTKLKRMAKYYPNEKIKLVMQKDIAQLTRQVGGVIDGWEF